MKSYRFTMPEPPSANRWWRTTTKKTKKGFRTITYLSEEARDYKASIARVGSSMLLDGPISVSIDWFRGMASGDLDKRIGVVLDAMQGVFYSNDKQIVELHARRFDDPGNARLVVTVSEAGPQGSII